MFVIVVDDLLFLLFAVVPVLSSLPFSFSVFVRPRAASSCRRQVMIKVRIAWYVIRGDCCLLLWLILENRNFVLLGGKKRQDGSA
jgi:hypothetical protein